MRIEHWYLTQSGWSCGTVSDDGVETAAQPPEGRVVILEISLSSAEQWEGATYRRIWRDENAAPKFEKEHGMLPLPLSRELSRRMNELNQRVPETREEALRPAADVIARRSLMMFGVYIVLMIFAFHVLTSPMNEHTGGTDWSTAFLLIGAAFVAAAIQLGLAIGAHAGGWASRSFFPGVILASLASIGSWCLGMLGMMAAAGGGAWGRPLRIRGKQRHPRLTEGADWTLGEQPDPRGLDLSTRRALEALWLHDAQKEHASVPAFARVSWLLAAAGAPAELLVWSHRAAIEEIEHTRACFALAAGYAGRSHTVEPMPDLLLAKFDSRQDPRATLAIESLGDGCQLEDFNADVAAACAAVCTEPATRGVLEKIAREERTHADFSWAVLDWLLAQHRELVAPEIERALEKLGDYPRPTASAHDKRALLALADPAALRAHGRLPDEVWGQLWDARLVETNLRVRARLDTKPIRAAA